MKTLKFISVTVLLCCCVALLSISTFADNFGLEDDFGDLDSEQTSEVASEETTVETSEISSDAETTEPETSEIDTTEPAETSEVRTEETTEVTTEELTDEPSEQVTEEPSEQTTEQPTEQETKEPAQSEPAGEQTTDDGVASDDGGFPIPLPVILVVLAVLGAGGVVACVVILKKFSVK